MRPALVLSAVVLVSACAAAPGPTETAGVVPTRLSGAEERGRTFALRRCAGCHAVGQGGGAQEGPAFRTLAFRYNPISLERRFAEVSEHGGDRMPAVSLTRQEAEDLLAYIATLQGL